MRSGGRSSPHPMAALNALQKACSLGLRGARARARARARPTFPPRARYRYLTAATMPLHQNARPAAAVLVSMPYQVQVASFATSPALMASPSQAEAALADQPQQTGTWGNDGYVPPPFVNGVGLHRPPDRKESERRLYKRYRYRRVAARIRPTDTTLFFNLTSVPQSQLAELRQENNAVRHDIT